MKNLIYGGIIVLCLVISGIVILVTRSGGSGGIDELSDDAQTWVFCVGCKASYEMGEKEFYTQLKQKSVELANPMARAYLTCQKCGKDRVVTAIKCGKCGEVFPEGVVPGDLADRCPKCKFSATEEKRKARLAQQSQN